ncbi:MAG TPA: PfkB family carbohydrate kinase [Rhodothermales bacterium]|nr:PfkB family carbohydrate kinase [Rhodothermales bacterium]
MKFDVCIIGHVTQDRLEIEGMPPHFLPGGSVYYAGVAACKVGLSTAALTKLNPADQNRLLADLRQTGVHVRCTPSPATTEFVNIYPDPDTRIQRVAAVAAPFLPEDAVPEADLYMLGPLTQADISLEYVQYLATLGRDIALDLQGLLRCVRGEQVVLSRHEQIPDILQHVRILKASEAEAYFSTGLSDLEGAARALAAHGPREVLITRGGLGSFILAEGRTYTIPAFPPPEIADTTGCGDTYLAAYISRRLAGGGPEEAGLFASKIAGDKTATYGPYRGPVEDVPGPRPDARDGGLPPGDHRPTHLTSVDPPGSRPGTPGARTSEIEEPTNLYIIHPLSRLCVRFFARLGIHPNAVSITGMVFGGLAALSYHQYARWVMTLLGFLLMIGWHVMDGADGQLARATGKTSEIGKVLDGICDHGTFILIYVSLALALTPRLGGWVWMMALVAGISHAVQASVYELQRQLYDYWVHDKASARVVTPEEVRRGQGRRGRVARCFAGVHVLYLEVQSRLAGIGSGASLNSKLSTILANAGDEGTRIREAYRTTFVDAVNRWSLLCSNYRTIIIFVVCLIGHPVLFFVSEIVLFNVILVVLLKMQQNRQIAFRKWLSHYYQLAPAA